MDNPGIVLQHLALGIHTLAQLPIVYMDMDSVTPIKTSPRPLLEIYVLLHGELDFAAANQQTCLTTGDILLTCAAQGNQATARFAGTRHSCTSLDISQIPKFHCPPNLFLVARGQETETLQLIVRELFFAYYAEAYPLQAVAVKQQYLALLLALIELVAAPGATPANGQDPRVRQCIRTLQERHGDPDLALADLAAQTHLSADHLMRLFRQDAGISPMQFLQQFRLDKACRLLRHSQLCIKQIAHAVGFRDALYFSRAFRKYHHLSPRAYRARQLSN